MRETARGSLKPFICERSSSLQRATLIVKGERHAAHVVSFVAASCQGSLTSSVAHLLTQPGVDGLIGRPDYLDCS